MRATDPKMEEGGIIPHPCTLSEALTPLCEQWEASPASNPPTTTKKQGRRCRWVVVAAAAWRWGPREHYRGRFRLRQDLGLNQTPEQDALSMWEGESYTPL